jgi:hypothetical protein
VAGEGLRRAREWRRRSVDRERRVWGKGRVVDRPILFGRQRLDCAVVKPWLSD